jgi:transposase
MTDTICDTKVAFGRVEIRTGVGRRRRWTAQEKGRIIAEALNSGVPVAEIARRHGMSSQHLFNWIRAAKGAGWRFRPMRVRCLCRLSRLRRR